MTLEDASCVRRFQPTLKMHFDPFFPPFDFIHYRLPSERISNLVDISPLNSIIVVNRVNIQSNVHRNQSAAWKTTLPMAKRRRGKMFTFAVD